MAIFTVCQSFRVTFRHNRFLTRCPNASSHLLRNYLISHYRQRPAPRRARLRRRLPIPLRWTHRRQSRRLRRRRPRATSTLTTQAPPRAGFSSPSTEATAGPPSSTISRSPPSARSPSLPRIQASSGPGPVKPGPSATAMSWVMEPTSPPTRAAPGPTWVSTTPAASAACVIHPTNPDIVYVCALGRMTGPQQERGVYRTLDGGTHWDRVLFVDENTGCSGLTMDAANPQMLFAGTWQVEMHTYGEIGGGPGSGVYVSHDGGTTWKRAVSPGLPKSPVGQNRCRRRAHRFRTASTL